MTNVKTLIRSLVRRAGYDFHRLTPAQDTAFQLLKGLEKFQVDLVLDVGANVGQFGCALRAAGYKNRIVSFEPLAEAHARLVRAATYDRLWTVHPRCAIGERQGEIDINIAGNSVSSSVLPMLDMHATAAVNSKYVGRERVAIERLDSVTPQYLTSSRAPFLKMDTQGYEWAVLDGARDTLSRIRGVLCELSLVPLYQGQHLWLAMLERLGKEGFTLWALQRGFTDPRDGRTLQVDAILFRI